MYGGGSGVSGDVTGVEDTEETVESSETSDVQLGLHRPELGARSGTWEQNHNKRIKLREFVAQLTNCFGFKNRPIPIPIL